MHQPILTIVSLSFCSKVERDPNNEGADFRNELVTDATPPTGIHRPQIEERRRSRCAGRVRDFASGNSRVPVLPVVGASSNRNEARRRFARRAPDRSKRRKRAIRCPRERRSIARFRRAGETIKNGRPDRASGHGQEAGRRGSGVSDVAFVAPDSGAGAGWLFVLRCRRRRRGRSSRVGGAGTLQAVEEKRSSVPLPVESHSSRPRCRNPGVDLPRQCCSGCGEVRRTGVVVVGAATGTPTAGDFVIIVDGTTSAPT